MSGPYLKKLSKNERYSDAVSLVKVAYMKRLDEEVFGDKARQPEMVFPPSRFYDVRPAVITSDWVQDDYGVWYAQAKFLGQNGIVNDGFVFPVWAPTATDAPSTTANDTRVYVLWRGRWEIVGGAGGDINLTAGVGIRIGGASPNYTIVNTGVTNFIAGGASYAGTLVFSGDDFTIDRNTQAVSIANRKTRVEASVTIIDSSTVEITFTLR